MLARRDPISLFPGMADHRTGRDGVVAVFQTIAPKFSNCWPLTFELTAATTLHAKRKEKVMKKQS